MGASAQEPAELLENLAGLALVNRSLIAKAEAIDSSQRDVLDADATEIPA